MNRLLWRLVVQGDGGRAGGRRKGGDVESAGRQARVSPRCRTWRVRAAGEAQVSTLSSPPPRGAPELQSTRGPWGGVRLTLSACVARCFSWSKPCACRGAARLSLLIRRRDVRRRPGDSGLSPTPCICCMLQTLCVCCLASPERQRRDAAICWRVYACSCACLCLLSWCTFVSLLSSVALLLPLLVQPKRKHQLSLLIHC